MHTTFLACSWYIVPEGGCELELIFLISTLTTWQHSCTYKWFHFDPWGETVPPCLPHLLTQAWCLCCIVLLNLVCLHNHLNISPKKSTRWRKGNTWIIILLLILLYYLFSWFFFRCNYGFLFYFSVSSIYQPKPWFYVQTNIGFQAEVCKQHASKVIIIRRETFFVTHLACSLCHLSCKLVARLLVSCRTTGNWCN